MRSSAVAAAPAVKADIAERQAFEVIDLGPFENNHNSIVAVNDLGQFAGVSLHEATGKIQAFRQEGGRRAVLGTLGGSFSIARSLNNMGEVVGGSLTEGDESFHGFLFRNNRLYDLNSLLHNAPAWEVIQAMGINNRGEILGVGASQGRDRIILLKPRT